MATRPRSQETETALIKQQLETISGKLTVIETQLESKYAQQTELALVRLEIAELRQSAVTKDQFAPVKSIVYGAVALILAGVLGALIALVVQKGSPI